MIDCYMCDVIKSSDDINKFNVETLYKVCKRLEKRWGISSMEFYRRIVKGGVFKFVGTYYDFI